MSFTRFFQLISYVQYPLMLAGMYYCLKPLMYGISPDNLNLVLTDYNKMLIFMGLSISFSTLQDTTKTQNQFSKKIWQNPKKGKMAIVTICIMIAVILSYGVFAYFITDNEKIQELSVGAIVLAIGMMGMLKSAIEMFENHRSDKKVVVQ